jgi:glutaredoxin
MATSRRSIVALVALVLAVGALSQWWGSRSEAQLGEQVAALAKEGDIRMLSSTTCAYCGAARHWLQQHGVRFDECFIENDAVCARDFEQARAAGTPLVVVRGQPQLGFDPRRVREALTRGG